MNIPNLLSLSRILAIPVFFYFYGRGMPIPAFGILVASLLTDFLDGWLARRLHQETELGALLDPVADKVQVLAYFGYLGFVAGILPWWVAAIYYARNLSQLLAVPILVWWLKKPFKVKPQWLAKVATGLSFVLIPMFFFSYFYDQDGGSIMQAQLVLLVVSLALEVYIFATYWPRLYAIAQGRHDTFE